MEPPAPPRATRGQAVVLLAITAAAAAWRLATLSLESIWYDEAISLHLARHSLDFILADRARDGHPPPYFFLLHYWVRVFGESPAALRAMSVIPGTAVVPLLYLVAARRQGPFAGLLAAAMAAGSQMMAHYSQEARDYAFLLFFATLSFWTLDRAWERPSAGRLVAWSLALAATLWTSVFGMAVVGTQALWLAGAGLAARSRRGSAPAPSLRAAVPWLLALGAAVALFVPWMLELRQRVKTVGQAKWLTLPELDDLYDAVIGLAGSRRGLALILPAVLAGAWFAVGPRSPDRPRGWTLVAWLLGPILVPFVLSYVAFPVYVRRGTIVSTGAFVVLAALGLDSLRPRRRLFFAVAALAATGLVYGAFRQVDRRDKEDWRALAGLVSARAAPHDLVLLRDTYEEVAYGVYATRDDLLLSTHAAAAEGRILWGEQRVVWLVESPHEREAEPAREALRAAGFTLRKRASAPMIWLERWER